ncbi:hypothetical protein [Clostridium sp.]|uniref:hypothetical protein n=1 Tax=Clostridium sp. TaxID=1506 RepID=UPI003F3CBFF0
MKGYSYIRLIQQENKYDKNQIINKSYSTQDILLNLTKEVKFKRTISEEAELRNIKRNTLIYRQIYKVVLETLKNSENYYSKSYSLNKIDYTYFQDKIENIKNNDFNKSTPLNALKVNWYSDTVIEYEILKKYLKSELIEKVTYEKIGNNNFKILKKSDGTLTYKINKEKSNGSNK